MILQALYELAQREDLMREPDYEPKKIAWIVTVSKDGKFLGFTGTHHISPEEQKKRKPKPVPKTFQVPREKGRTSGDRAFFLFDKAEYVFGIDPAGERPAEELAARFKLFREKVETCAQTTGDEGVMAIARCLNDVASGKQIVTLPESCASNDLFAFVYEPDVDLLVTDRPQVRAFWKDSRVLQKQNALGSAQCLVSGGKLQGEVGNFPPVKIPGGTTSGVALVSFNSSAFESYGWSGNENAPISRNVAEACSTALKRLLDPAYPDPAHPGQTLRQLHLRLSADTVVCYWSAESSSDELCGLFGALFEANPSQVKELYHSIWRGKYVEIKDTSAFYALTLTGAQGRAIVRDWFESTVGEVAHNLAEHFLDLDIVRNTPKPKEHDLPPQIPLTVLLRSLAPFGDSDKIPAPLIGEMVRAAFHGTPYPFSILQRALERTRAEIGKTEWSDLERRDARAALVKAVLNRRKRFHPQTALYKEVKPDMDPTNTSPGYLLGRLMAVIERMQQTALNNVNASVVDRFFAGASATPGVVFPRLLKNLRHHARKAKDDPRSAKTAGWLEGQVDAILAGVTTFPPHLNLEQQGLFVLGYHHQRHWLWSKKEDRESQETNA